MRPPAVILAGGKSSRMGRGDKCLLPLGGKLILTRIVETLAPQVSDILINANGDAGCFDRYGYAVEPDSIPGSQGPLAGLLTGMQWSRKRHPKAAYILSAPSDTPLLPTDLVTRLAEALTWRRADIAIAESEEGTHPTIGLWPVDLAAKLEFDLMETDVRSLHRWMHQFKVATARFESSALLNLNTPAELAACEEILRAPPSVTARVCSARPLA
jgi:molybdopterin-guanine dinucleotide biosynthesis protein A